MYEPEDPERGEPRTLPISDLERIERYTRAGLGGSVADALERWGSGGTVLSSAFQPIVPDAVLTGRALPVRVQRAPEGRQGPNWGLDADYWDPRGGHPQKRLMTRILERDDGTVLCFDASGDLDTAYFGDMMVLTAQRFGARGMLLAANCRDTKVLRTLGFPIYSLGTHPAPTVGWEIIVFDESILLPGHERRSVRVGPDDWIYGDADGVQIIPARLVDEVLLYCEEVFETEIAERDAISGGRPIEEMIAEYRIL